MEAWGIPAINTLLLLSSGVTVTWAHWGLKKNNRSQLIWGWRDGGARSDLPVSAGARIS